MWTWRRLFAGTCVLLDKQRLKNTEQMHQTAGSCFWKEGKEECSPRSINTQLKLRRAGPAPVDTLQEGYIKVEWKKWNTLPTASEPHLSHSRIDLQNLLMAFDLAHADFAGELGGDRAVSLQREGTVQGLLVAAPHLGEGEFLRREKRENRSATSHSQVNMT